MKYHVRADKVLHGRTLGEVTKEGWGLGNVGADLDSRCRPRSGAKGSCFSEEIEDYALGQ